MRRKMKESNENVIVFGLRFQQACPRLVTGLREYIKKDVDNTNEKLIHLKHYCKYQIALPPLHSFTEEFRVGYEEALIDMDVKSDLERSNVINWCRTTKQLLPLKTTADGNCLLHAVSQALWGIEDDENFLRRLVYAAISIDSGEQYKRRWMFHQRSLLQSATADFRLNTEEHNLEWDNVIRATEDTRSPEAHGLPYKMLEAIHLFAIANILKRPIVLMAETVARNVYGTALQDSHIGGIYLPLHTDPKRCVKSPLVISYSLNHFTPLVFETDSQTGHNEMAAIPLVLKDFSMLEIKFLLPYEETGQAQEILGKYLILKEVVYDVVPIPVAAMKAYPLPQAVNVIDGYRKVSEQKFQQLLTQEEVPARNVPQPNQPGPHLFTLPIDGNQAQGGKLQGTGDEKCCTVNCQNLSEQNLHGLCVSCFNDFTIQYAKQEEAKRKILQGQPPIPYGFQRYDPNMMQQMQQTHRPAPTNQRQGPPYYDLSMMGEDCHANCGFKCATETYPYCHECYPKYVTEPANQAAKHDTQSLQQPDLSMLPDKCCTMGCTFRCSKATAPYCHECYERNGPPVKTTPTAPPPSVPLIQPQQQLSPTQAPYAMVPQLTQYQAEPQMRPYQAENSDETTVVSLRGRTYIQPSVDPQKPPVGMVLSGHGPQKMMQAAGGPPHSPLLHKQCQTMNCKRLAEKGNNGYCDNCYQLTLFGNNVQASPASPASPAYSASSCGSVCSTLNCTNIVVMPSKKQCNNCFLQGRPIVEQSSPQPWSPSSPNDPIVFNITQSEDTHKILNLNHQRPPTQVEIVPQQTEQQFQSLPTEHDETHVLAPSALGLQIQKHAMYDLSTQQKYICATPGCHGFRTEPTGFCSSCQQGSGAQLIHGSENIEHHQQMLGEQGSGKTMNSDPYISESPVQLTKEQIRKINPVVLSSKDKVKCSYKLCSNMIYPPKTLCDTCTADLDRLRSQQSRHKSKELAELSGENQKCKTQGCQFFGAKQNNGYCSSCLKGKVPSTPHSTEPLAKLVPLTEGERSHSAPVLAVCPQVLAPPSPRNPQPMAAPISNSGSQRRGFQCLQPGCSKFGDQNQGYRCSQHFIEMTQGPQLSQESIAQLRQNVYPYPNGNQGQQPMNGQNFRPHGNTVGAVTVNTTPQKQNFPTYLPSTQSTHSRQTPANNQTSDQFNRMYQRVETTKKSRTRCKNNATIGCPNWGNSSKQGYCNNCHENLMYMRTSY